MKIKKINKHIFNKIQEINYALFILLFYFNLLFTFLIEEKNLSTYFFIILNFLIIIFFFFINHIYKKEFILEQEKINLLIN
jgi:hypothetical protein